MRESSGIDLAIFLCVIFLVVSALGTSGYRPGYLGLSQLLSHSNSPCTIGSKFSLNSSHHSLLLPFCYPSGNLSTAEVSCFHFHITPETTFISFHWIKNLAELLVEVKWDTKYTIEENLKIAAPISKSAKRLRTVTPYYTSSLLLSVIYT